jgi:thioredoxin reductase
MPATELFRRTALDTGDGIKVNKFLETNVPGVWAAGDIANYPDQFFPSSDAGGALGQRRGAGGFLAVRSGGAFVI